MKNRKDIWTYLHDYKFNSLILRNFLFVVVFAAVPLLLVVHENYRSFQQETDQNMAESNLALLSKCSIVVDNMVSEVREISEGLLLLPECDYLCENAYGTKEYTIQAERMNAEIEDYLKLYPYVESICLYSSLNEIVADGTSLMPIKKIKNLGKWYDAYWDFGMELPFTMVAEKGTIMYCVPVYRADQLSEGLLIIHIDTKVLGKRLESEEISQDQIFLITGIGGEIIYCSNEDVITEERKLDYQRIVGSMWQLENSRVLAEKEKVVSVVRSAHQSWKYALITDLPVYTEEMSKTRNFLTKSILMGLLPSLLAAYLITFVTYRPVKKIIKVIEEPQEYIGRLEQRRDSSEMLYITSNILNTLSRKEKMETELEERVAALKQAQSQALQFQVDPHFLYNTLEMLNWTAVEEMGSGNNTSRLLVKVASLYRIALQSEKMILSLEEEIEFLHLYMDILDVRYSGKIQYECRIDQSFYDCRVIKLCIQPLIENAIKHGLKPKRYCGTIWISAIKEGDNKFSICVENDGLEMSDSAIEALNQTLAKRNGIRDSQVGLMNINERIKLLYGLEYGVSIEKRGGGQQGMRVKVSFPFGQRVCRERPEEEGKEMGD
ncbi:MAG: histidine kinase [Lachnospiraceae bacterium]|nr:histidine kinase [Lachnospiraceae bacterium]